MQPTDEVKLMMHQKVQLFLFDTFLVIKKYFLYGLIMHAVLTCWRETE